MNEVDVLCPKYFFNELTWSLKHTLCLLSNLSCSHPKIALISASVHFTYIMLVYFSSKNIYFGDVSVTMLRIVVYESVHQHLACVVIKGPVWRI